MSPCVNKNGVSYGTSGHHHFSFNMFYIMYPWADFSAKVYK
uniref:Uncharacterized protein n=1 Tax=Anguilla anguilla TaxID=7936 RepID=A0A0E9W1T6_ANGAN